MCYLYLLRRSILSQYNGTSTEGGSFRCNNPQQWTAAYYPSTTTECTSTNTPHHHLPPQGHQHNYPPQYNQHHFQHQQQPHTIIANGALPPHGRLQKSLSFAFTTPASTMMNEVYHPSCQNQSNPINYPERSYSR